MAAGVCVSGFISASVQFEAMRFLSAAKAQPFSALQPLFAGLFGYAALGEPVSLGTWIGGVLMIGAALLGCTDADEEIKEVVEAPTPEQTRLGLGLGLTLTQTLTLTPTPTLTLTHRRR